MNMELDSRIVDTMYKINAKWKRYATHISKMAIYLDQLSFMYVGSKRLVYSNDSLGNYYEIQKFYNNMSPFKDYFLFLVTRFESDSFDKFTTKSLAFFMCVSVAEEDLSYEKALETFREVICKNPEAAICTTYFNDVISGDVENVKPVEETTKFVHKCDDATRFVYKGNVYLGKLTEEDFAATVFIEDVKTERMWCVLSDNKFKNLMPVYKYNKPLFFKRCIERIKNVL